MRRRDKNKMKMKMTRGQDRTGQECKNMHLHVEKLARLGGLSVVWAPAAGLFSTRGPLQRWRLLAVCSAGLMQDALLAPAFRIAKFVAGLVTLPEKIVR
jgi:hypothetical protein